MLPFNSPQWLPPLLASLPGPTETLENLLGEHLLQPLQTFLSRPSKQLRTQLVFLGAALAQTDPPSSAQQATLQELSALIELIHAGSLIIDDIEDQSLYRRGQATFHREHGLSKALNAGNWLYFFALKSLLQTSLPPASQQAALIGCLETFHEAHLGQTLDLHTPLDSLCQTDIPALCLSAMILKSGTLTALALQLGALAVGTSAETCQALKDTGLDFGSSLQQWDDIGNFQPAGVSCAPSLLGKRYEDLRLKRPSWIWAVAAETASPVAFQAFRKAVSALPEETALEAWLADYPLRALAQQKAQAALEALLKKAEERFKKNSVGFSRLKKLALELSFAYELTSQNQTSPSCHRDRIGLWWPSRCDSAPESSPLSSHPS